MPPRTSRRRGGRHPLRLGARDVAAERPADLDGRDLAGARLRQPASTATDSAERGAISASRRLERRPLAPERGERAHSTARANRGAAPTERARRAAAGSPRVHRPRESCRRRLRDGADVIDIFRAAPSAASTRRPPGTPGAGRTSGAHLPSSAESTRAAASTTAPTADPSPPAYFAMGDGATRTTASQAAIAAFDSARALAGSPAREVTWTMAANDVTWVSIFAAPVAADQGTDTDTDTRPEEQAWRARPGARAARGARHARAPSGLVRSSAPAVTREAAGVELRAASGEEHDAADRPRLRA